MPYLKVTLAKFKHRIHGCKGWTMLLTVMSFLPVIILITVLGLQFANYSSAFKQSRQDIQALYVAEMGIERYKNEIKSDPTYSEVLTFTKVIDGKTYNVQVVSIRMGAPEKVKITSTVLDMNIVSERIITVSRITS